MSLIRGASTGGIRGLPVYDIQGKTIFKGTVTSTLDLKEVSYTKKPVVGLKQRKKVSRQKGFNEAVIS